MTANRRRSAFTLIEILIVVVIMAVLAATIIPQFSTSQNDSKVATAKYNLFQLRSLVQLYTLQHGNTLPTSAVANQFTQYSDVTGAVSTTTDATHIYGPYCQGIPVNPFSASNTITIYTGTGTPTASGSASAGWIYGSSTGSFWIDNATYLGQL